MWVSTGKAGSPNAWAITTPAVLWPTPGRASRASQSCGTSLLCSSTSMRESCSMCLLLAGDSPQGRIISRIASRPRAAMSPGLSARAKSAGVTWFTFLSVHCADNSTATNKV